MPSSRFSTRPTASSNPDNRSSPQKSRFKTFSAFLFSSSAAHQSPSPPHHHVIPSAPMPYRPPPNYFSLSNATTLRVLVRDGLPNGPLHQMVQNIDFPGLPMKYNEMPSLASAINIADNARQPFSSTSETSQGALSMKTSDTKLPRSASNSSSLKTFRRGRSDSRSSIIKVDGLQRRMSRRLSFDNILPLFNSSTRKKDRTVSAEQPLLGDQRYSTSQSTDRPAWMSSLAETSAPRVKRMALPPTRTLRSRFAVGVAKDTSGLLSIAKADLAARQATREKEFSRYAAEPSKTFQAASLGSAAGRGMAGALKKMAERKRGEDSLELHRLGISTILHHKLY